ncbi:alpha/beta hydrolase [Microbacterium sp. GXF7504]
MSAGAISAEIRGGAWAAGLPAAGPGSDACADIPGIAGLVLRYVQPLRDLFDDLLGDPATVAGFAASWEDTSASLTRLGPDLATGRAALAALDGRTVRALRERYEDLEDIARDAAEWTGATAAGLRLASRVIEATRSFVCDVLVQLSRLADEMFSFTLNPFAVADRVKDFASAAYDAVRSAARLVDDLIEAISALADLIRRLMPIVAEGLARLRELIAQLAPIAGGLIGALAGGVPGAALGLLVGGAVENFLQQDADVEELDPTTLPADRYEHWRKANEVTSLDSLGDLVSVNGTTDGMGGADATVIDVKRVVGADGTEHWVVSLPSTQDWQLGPDAGALNDRDSNLALMLDNPALRSVYERAVLEAMSDAGIPRGADVVLTGFSQGGIMAANLAADRSFPYNTVGVVTNGSPIDSFDIPRDIPVYAFQHANDPVPMLDGEVTGSTPPNVHRVVLPAADDPIAAHDNSLYTESVRTWEEQYAATHGGPPPSSELFGGQVVDHSMFAASER